MFKKFVVYSLVLVIMLIASGCGSNNGSRYLGRWENLVETNDIASFTISESGDHYVFDLFFGDDSGMSVPATYEDGFFTLHMPGYTWSAYYDDSSGYLILDGRQFRKVN